MNQEKKAEAIHQILEYFEDELLTLKGAKHFILNIREKRKRYRKRKKKKSKAGRPKGSKNKKKVGGKSK